MRHRLVLATLVGALVFLLAVVGYGSYYISQQSARERDARRQVVNEINLRNCRDIEALKEAQRKAAVLSFSRLDETLRLLRLAKTPELVASAKRNRDEALRRFRAEPCPRETV